MISHQNQPNQDGFVSLFTCILISLLLSIITISMVSLESLQLRKSEDAEQSTRAYYAAEAGVEDAASKVLAELASGASLTNQSCQQNLTFDSVGTGTGWTCQQISFSGSPTGVLPQADLAKTVDPGSGANFKSVIIDWGDKSSSSAPNYYDVPLASGFPTAANYQYEPSLELTVVQYPNGTFAAGDPGLKLQNAVLAPAGSGPGTGTVDYSAGLSGNGPYRAHCGPLPQTDPQGTTGYNCYAILENLPANANFLFRLRTRYSAASYQMTFMSGTAGNGTTVAVPSGVATIDVTAKAGDAYRRVVSQLPIANNAAGALNYVMYSDTDICKDFEVIDGAAQPGCPY